MWYGRNKEEAEEIMLDDSYVFTYIKNYSEEALLKDG
jgi:hypothetical protein